MDFLAYRDFLKKVDDKFQEIAQKHPQDFQCKLGCHSCCKPNLTVNELEHSAIQDFFDRNPEALIEAQRLATAKPHGKKRCAMLDEKGACAIYEARPLVCRSHGAPLQFRDPDSKEEDRFRDVCPLNFTGKNIGELEPIDVINLDTINTLLALLTKRASYGSKRFPLAPESFRSK